MAPAEVWARMQRVLAGGGIVIPDPVFRAMVAHARAEAPREACGVVSGGPVTGMAGFLAVGYHPVGNTAGDQNSFIMDPHHLGAVLRDIEARGLMAIGVFHTHPRGEPVPSVADAGSAMSNWPHLVHLIMSLSDPRWRRLRAYRVDGAQAVPLALAVVPWPGC